MLKNRLAERLRQLTDLTADDEALLDTITARRRAVKRHSHLVYEGDEPEGVFVIIEGWAARYKLLPDGSRQIVAFLIPGDLCDVHIFILDRMDHGVVMLANGMVAIINKATIVNVLETKGAISRVLSLSSLVDEAVLREWLINVGSRDARMSLAHLICELYVRLDNVGLVQNGSVDFPLTQSVIGEALGMTAVHVNRMVNQLRSDGVLEIRNQKLTVIDFPALQKIAGFNPAYLHTKASDDSPVP